MGRLGCFDCINYLYTIRIPLRASRPVCRNQQKQDMLVISIISLLLIPCLTLNYSSIPLNLTLTPQQISQYNDSIQIRSGPHWLTHNFTANTTVSQVESTAPGCNLTDYVLVQRKKHLLWHFQICNLSAGGATAGSAVLKVRNLMTGGSYDGNMTVFGEFTCDEDYPWFYSQATRQMVLPWYFMKTIQKLSFSVNSPKLMLTGPTPRLSYQKSRSPSSTSLYSLEGYPDDNATHTIITQQLPVNVSQACVAANGRYVVMLVLQDAGVGLQVFNAKLREVVYRDVLAGWEETVVKLRKVNETHVVLARGGLQPQFRIYDLRIPSPISIIQLPPTLPILLTPTTLLTPYLHNNTLVFHSSSQPNQLHILTQLPLQLQIRTVYITQPTNDSNICQEPGEIVQGQYCVICGYLCAGCQGGRPDVCLGCSFGFRMEGGTCVPGMGLVVLMDVYAGLSMVSMFDCLLPIQYSLDNLHMYNYHNIRHHPHSKSLLLLIHQLHNHKYLPYSLTTRLPSLNYNSPPRSPLLPLQYVQHLGSTPREFGAVGLNVWVFGVLACGVLWGLRRGFKAVGVGGRWMATGVGLVGHVIATRVGYVSWVFWSQISVPSTQNLQQRLTLAGLVSAYFIIIFYTLSYYPLLKWLYNTRPKTLSPFHLFHRSHPHTFRLLTLQSTLFLLNCHLHIFLPVSPVLQQSLLFLSSFLKLLVVMCHYRVYELVLHYFTALFCQVSMFLYMGVLLLDRLECPELFEVEIKLVAFVGLVMLLVLAGLQALACLGVAVRRGLIRLLQEISRDSNLLDKQNKANRTEGPRKSRTFYLISRPGTQKSIQIPENQGNNLAQKLDQPDYIRQPTPNPSLLSSFLSYLKSSNLVSTSHSFNLLKSNKVSPVSSPSDLEPSKAD